MNCREKREILDTYPVEKLLQVGTPTLQWYYQGGQYQALCPFHNDQSIGSFGFNPAKRLWKCFVCGKGGKEVYSLVMEVNGWDYRTAIDYLYDNKDNPVSGVAGAPAPSKRKPVTGGGIKLASSKGDSEMAFPYTPDKDPVMLHQIYAAFVEASSSLTGVEENAFRKARGIYFCSMKDFFRFPSPTDEEFMRRFRKELEKHDNAKGEERLYHQLLGTPGFFWNKQEGEIGFIGHANSLGIVNHDENGLINGIELRLQDKLAKKGSRYMPFSTEGICARYPDRFEYGASAGSIIDVVQPAFDDKPYKGLAVTEGKFKALHLSYLGYKVLNVHGIGNWRNALELIEKMGEKSVSIAFDADSRENLSVAEHTVAFGLALGGRGIEVNYLTWPARYGKGVDDLINNGYKHKLRTVPSAQYLETTLMPFIIKEKAKKEAQG